MEAVLAVYDDAYVERYEAWFDTEQGAFAFEMEHRLVHHLVSAWPRRGQKLVEIGCGTGRFLLPFYESGFDVTGIDQSPAMLKMARSRLGHHADFHVGVAEHLPFDDNEFDYAVLATVLEFCDDPLRAMQEAVRVARKGVLVAFLNSYSLYRLSRIKKRGTGMLSCAQWFTPAQIMTYIGEASGNKPCRARSVLPGPPSTWRSAWPWKLVNGLVYPVWLGGFCAIRCDLYGDQAKTPLMALNTEPNVG